MLANFLIVISVTMETKTIATKSGKQAKNVLI